MAVVGFNTKSKKLAVESEKNSPQIAEMPTSPLQAESYERVNDLGDMIMSAQFATLPVAQKQAMLIDFAYFKNVAEALN